MKKETLRKALTCLSVAGLIAGVAALNADAGSSCCSSGSGGSGKADVSDSGKSSCGKGSCGAKTEDTGKSSCGKGSCGS